MNLDSIHGATASYALLRITAAARERLEKHLYKRYPDREWGTFFRFGYRVTAWGLLITYVDGLWPEPGELNRQSPIVDIQSCYSLRALDQLHAEPLGIGVIHSHPQGCGVGPSSLDDDMDGYYEGFFGDFAKDRPYASLIFSRDEEGDFSFSGRIWHQGKALSLHSLHTVGEAHLTREESRGSFGTSAGTKSRNATARLDAALGNAGSERLKAARVAVIGCSGTGSPAIEMLARAGVGEFVVVDFDTFDDSNLERIHGSGFGDLKRRPLKVRLMVEMIRAINPECRVTAIVGNILDEEVIDEILRCDVALGCTDTNHSRAMLGDLASHYLLPSIDVGVGIESGGGKISAQICDFAINSPGEPCPYCDGRIDQEQLAVELMSDEEKAQRKTAALEAEQRGIDGRQYWRGEPPHLLTVGYITTAAGSLLAGYTIGWLTGAFSMPHQRFQFDINAPLLGTIDVPRSRHSECSCRRLRGWADQALSDRAVSKPPCWPAPELL